ncbi:MAG: ABC transporter substrate-binding protein [Alphaproteobacteria bacterium]|nr:ABC transporter substrate-binding protein [Alphaproteobacteria bacterium]
MNTPELIPFRIGKASPANTFLAIWMARAAGLYTAEGLDAEIIEMVGGSETGPALGSGHIHLMHIGMSSVVRANARGANVTTIGSLSNVVRSTLFTAPNVKTSADLKGGIVGISSAGSESDLTTTLALTRLGLKRGDVTIKEIGVERLSPVRDGTVHATMLGEPYRAQALALGLNPIIDLLADQIPWLYSGLVVDQTYLKDNFDTVSRFMRATVEGNYLAVSDAGRAKQVLAAELNLTDPEVTDITYANFRSATPINAEVTRAGAENIIAAVDLPDTSRDVDDYIDVTVFDRLAADGFYTAMEQKYRPDMPG